MADWPRLLEAASGPIPIDKLDGAAEGMGEFGPETRALADDGLVPPDMMTGLTLFILSSQPKTGREKMAGGGGGVAGGVWVRERYTIHRPLAREDVFSITGESVGRHVRKGRRYGTTRSETRNAAGDLAADNLTTGLLAYKVQEGLSDQLEGPDPDSLRGPEPDWAAAANNPGVQALRELKAGETLGGTPVFVSLALMQARDTKNPNNPIHSDPGLAKQAGLSRPIAGGSHVQAFVLEPLLARVGRHALFHGASFDIRWKAPVYADTTMTPHVRVLEVTTDRVVCELEAVLENDSIAMTGTVAIPLP